MGFHYTPYYCEENIWFLCQEPQFINDEAAKVLIVSNDAKACALWNQRVGFGGPVVWDYHVIFLVGKTEKLVWDLDTTLGVPVDFDHYMCRTFLPTQALSTEFPPAFRIIDAAEYVRVFSSDRSHMRDSNGQWLAPPPPWPAILNEDGTKLMDLIDMRSGALGVVVTFQDFFPGISRL